MVLPRSPKTTAGPCSVLDQRAGHRGILLVPSPDRRLLQDAGHHRQRPDWFPKAVHGRGDRGVRQLHQSGDRIPWLSAATAWSNTTECECNSSSPSPVTAAGHRPKRKYVRFGGYRPNATIYMNAVFYMIVGDHDEVATRSRVVTSSSRCFCAGSDGTIYHIRSTHPSRSEGIGSAQ
jgi:hypothetical protein